MNRATSATGWVKNPDGTPGYTWNPITGCLNHVDGMCKGGNFPCYAHRLAWGRLRHRYLDGGQLPPLSDEHGRAADRAMPFYPRFWPSRLVPPHRIGSPGPRARQRRGVFVCDMADLFGPWIPEDWQRKVFSSIRTNRYDRFYLLTKQPQEFPKWSPFPENCWVGVTVTSNAAMTLALTRLASVEATVKYLSIEPLLGDLGMNDHMSLKDAGISWVIIGAQTKPYKPPKIEWVQEIVEAADRAGIPVFLKDNLKPLLFQGGVPDTYPHLFETDSEDPEVSVNLRQEMPDAMS